MKKKIIKRLEAIGFACEVEFDKPEFGYNQYNITVYDKSGKFLEFQTFGYFSGAKTGAHTKEEFEKDLEKFINKLSDRKN